MRKADGTDVYSESFPVRRGVVQGDIFSPLCFIVALECIFKRCDTEELQPGGIAMADGETILRRLEYADDAALLCNSVEEASRRTTATKVTSWTAGDMIMALPKTFCMHCHEAVDVPDVTENDIRRFAQLGRLGACVQCDFCGDYFSMQMARPYPSPRAGAADPHGGQAARR